MLQLKNRKCSDEFHALRTDQTGNISMICEILQYVGTELNPIGLASSAYVSVIIHYSLNCINKYEQNLDERITQ